VLRQIQEHGYVPRRDARALAGGRTGLIGLTLPYLLGDYFGQLVSGAIDALYERDARVVVCPTHHERRREVSLLERLMHGTTDGGLLILPSETPSELAALQGQGYPFVVLDPRVPLGENIPVVASANWAGARMATEHLITLGHVRIGVITGTRDWYATVGPGGRLPVGAARCRSAHQSPIGRRGRLHHRGWLQRGPPPAGAPQPTDGHLRLQRQHGGGPPDERPRSVAWRCRQTCRSSATTTLSRPTSRRHS